MVSFPTVLPLVRGFSFEEGSIHDEFITRDFDKVHDLFEDFTHLKTKAYTCDRSLFDGEVKMPKPDSEDIVFFKELPLKLLIKVRSAQNNCAYEMIKREVDRFKGTLPALA